MRDKPVLLIADDHELIRQGVKNMLGLYRRELVCHEASDGRETVTTALRLRPDLVIMDISMPKLNGLDAARRIRKALPKTEILILTMHESEELLREIIEAGARGYVLKSDGSEMLMAAVDALLHHKPMITPKYAMMARELMDQPFGRGLPSDHLTPRERQIVQMLAEGAANKTIAHDLAISVKTVETHRTNIMRKLRLHSISALVRYAIRNRLVQV